MDSSPAPGFSSEKPSFAFFVLLLLLAFSLRLYWMLTQTPGISAEAEYLRMAENLRAGHGLVGSYGVPETMYTPLYPVLIFLTMHLGTGVELAAHLVSLVLGTCLVLPVFFIARRMYGLQTAYLSALLAAVFPFLIARAGSIYTEAIYPALLLTAVYFGMRALELRNFRDSALCGACFGLAYLTRPEAFAYPIFFAFALLVMLALKQKLRSVAALHPALVVAAFILVASPYIFFLHAQTGQWRLEGKWNINYTAGVRIHAGMTDWQALYGYDGSDKNLGPLLDPLRFASYTPYPDSWRDKLRYMLSGARFNRDAVYSLLLLSVYGEPVLLVLVTIALFRHPWSFDRLIHEIVLITMALSIIVLMLTAHHVEFRYADPLLSLCIPWAAEGLLELRDWGRELIAGLSSRLAPVAPSFGYGLLCAFCFCMLVLSFIDTRSFFDFRIAGPDYLTIKTAALRIRGVAESKRIAAMNAMAPYYADGTLVQFPYATPEQTLRYLEIKNVDFIVLEGHFSRSFPTIGDWIQHGIPDQRAQLLYDTGGPTEYRVVVYRWQSAHPS